MANPHLFDARIQRVLGRLHDQARGDKWKFARRMPLLLWAAARKQLGDPGFEHRFFHDVYIPVSRSQGDMMYLLARSIGARRIVEFGTSFGISAIYLGAAVRDNGGGEVIGSELEPSKLARATENIEEAGLSAFVRIIPGDARHTFQSIESPVDLVLLDGWKEMYLPILQLLAPKLRQGAVVLADNIFTFRKSLRPFVEYMQSGKNGFVSTTLRISDGFEFSVYIAGLPERDARATAGQ